MGRATCVYVYTSDETGACVHELARRIVAHVGEERGKCASGYAWGRRGPRGETLGSPKRRIPGGQWDPLGPFQRKGGGRVLTQIVYQ